MQVAAVRSCRPRACTHGLRQPGAPQRSVQVSPSSQPATVERNAMSRSTSWPRRNAHAREQVHDIFGQPRCRSAPGACADIHRSPRTDDTVVEALWPPSCHAAYTLAMPRPRVSCDSVRRSTRDRLRAVHLGRSAACRHGQSIDRDRHVSTEASPRSASSGREHLPGRDRRVAWIVQPKAVLMPTSIMQVERAASRAARMRAISATASSGVLRTLAEAVRMACRQPAAA